MTPRFGDILHYRWGGDGTVHSSAMFVRATQDFRYLLLPVADTNYVRIDPILVSKDGSMWETCTPACPFNAQHPKENQ